MSAKVATWTEYAVGEDGWEPGEANLKNPQALEDRKGLFREICFEGALGACRC